MWSDFNHGLDGPFGTVHPNLSFEETSSAQHKLDTRDKVFNPVRTPQLVRGDDLTANGGVKGDGRCSRRNIPNQSTVLL